MDKNHSNFTALYNSLYQPIYNFISMRVRNNDEVEDLVQDVFLKAYNYWKTLPEKESAKNFLYHIAKQRMIDLWKSGRKKYELVGEMSVDDLDQPGSDPLPEDIFEQSEKRQQAVNILNSLRPSDRDILYLRFMDEKEYSEISEILNISEDHARQKVSRALSAARKIAI
jgi:RNA polymerase sigma factor (sigma-70 family)